MEDRIVSLTAQIVAAQIASNKLPRTQRPP